MEYKRKIMNLLVNDNELARAILIKDSNFKDFDYPTVIHKASMENKNIFSYLLIPKLQDTIESYVLMSFNFDYSKNSIISYVTVTFNILTHIQLQEVDYDFLRLDFIVQKIKEILNRNNDFSSKLYLINEVDLPPANENYIGSKLVFKTIMV